MNELEAGNGAGPGPARAAEVVTPPSGKTDEGETSVTGRLVSIDCSGSSLKFHIETGPGQAIVLVARDPSSIRQSGGVTGPRRLACGPQAGAPRVVAGYSAAASTGVEGAAGELRKLDFQ